MLESLRVQELTSNYVQELRSNYRARLLRRVVSELRDGQPVVLQGSQSLVVIAAEAVTELSLKEISVFGSCDLLLLLATGRAALLGHLDPRPPETPLAFRVPLAALSPPVLKSLVDPTIPQVMSLPSGDAVLPVPDLADLVFTLIKRSKLLPAALALPVSEAHMNSCAELKMTIASVADVRIQLEQNPRLIRLAEADFPVRAEHPARVIIYRDIDDDTEHVAVVFGDPANNAAPLVRLHSACLTGESLGSLRCDCAQQLDSALERMALEGTGILIYLLQEGRGIGLSNKLRAYRLQDLGYDTLKANHALGWESDARRFDHAGAILRDLNVEQIRLLSNNPDKIAQLKRWGIVVVA